MDTAAFVVMYVTCPSQTEAEQMAESLVVQRLAACVNIIPQITSVYRWEGAIEKASEWLLVIKTHRDKMSAVEEHVKSLHSYTVPEVIGLPVLGGSSLYLDWLAESVS